ncbi:ABC transporter substrate-binding protein [Mesotoga sp. Brook.08.YT.4.2.5.1]|uniref:ABC transporter substrate-binding protein n=1 Tax=unclassified Mesotoga TaxID=1184398 RepID=UPI000C187AAF|nr:MULTISPECIES: ABC transporter substrate-binding protein [unclassified Mesotoga]RAM59037.1 ABC transporter substrate-binding protein [Mesotoga sp. SC_4PWL113PWK15]PNE22633.1 ABC transporter substrate-binding protein [Mesotoga sp. Brook.08.YT.4.2.5.1]PVD17676.1 ABC transporter substrate-binding protein [Mesotoga sp. Brook.08.105.5.1]RAO95777.1 ABC transporter substrate-binding protein [Mesotoga sp. Brook.08.YT.4.2.5.4.]RDI94141.1 ABC transporter substrate-binding protein [Mesotoga sp. Brook.0
MKKLLVLLVVLIAVGILFAAPEYHVEETWNGKPGGTFYYWGLGDPKTFNYDWAQETSSTDPLGFILATLIEADEGGMPSLPGLAKDWWFSDDGLTFFVQIREGIQWSDGAPFTLDDVYWTFVNVSFVPENTANGNGSYLDSNDQLPVVEIVDDTTISFTWTVPQVTALRQIGFRPIMPKHVLEEVVANGTYPEFWTIADFDKLVGMGPFVITDYIEGVRIVFERNPYYWKVDGNGVRLPYFDKLNYELLADQNTSLLRFEAGQIDLYGPTAEQFPRLAEMAADKGWITGVGGPALGSQFITFNFNNPDPVKREWFRNDGFRRAFVYAMDRDAIIESLYNGLGSPLYGPVSPSSGFYYPEIEKFDYKYSITRARLQLRRGGFDWLPDGTCVDANGNPIEFELTTNAGNVVREAISNIIVDGAAKLGIKVNFRPIDFNTVVSRLTDATYDAVVIGLTGSVDPGTGWNVYRLDGGLHFWNYPPDYNPDDHITEDMYILPDWEKRVDEIYRLQTSAVDPQDRYDLFAEFQMLFAEYQPLVFTIAQNFLYVYKNNIKMPVEKLTPATGLLFQLEGWWKE